MRPLNWSQTTITFDPSDQLRCLFMAGKLPMMCTPTISHVLVTKTLIDSGAGLNILSVHLPVTIGERKNYHTEIIVLDVAHIHLPYNAILGYPALAKFMVVTHHGYNVLKMPGSGDIITIACDEKDAICTLERAYRAAAAERSNDEEDEQPREDPRKKKKQLPPWSAMGLRAPCPGTGSCLPSHRKGQAGGRKQEEPLSPVAPSSGGLSSAPMALSSPPSASAASGEEGTTTRANLFTNASTGPFTASAAPPQASVGTDRITELKSNPGS
ncbi:hypothetical protein ZWY2020_020688 [Hordeum vulgare]|nr:hypothetical protein ZWY2020_020688 [Hordeum vulgare]